MSQTPPGEARHQPGRAIGKIKDKVLHSDGFFFTLLRSSVSSQVCGWIDTLTAFMAFALFGLTAWLSTAIGAFVGGVLNCIINYRYTFHAYGVAWRVALTKFIFVWAGSLLLNSFGTEWVFKLINGWEWLHHIKWEIENGIFLTARLTVSLIVSICWNFLLQRHFVFTTTRLDPAIGRMLCALGLDGKKKSQEKNGNKHQ